MRFDNNQEEKSPASKRCAMHLHGQTSILTDRGFVYVCELKKGDTVFSTNGSTAKIGKITRSSPVELAYVVSLSNGESFIIPDGDFFTFDRSLQGAGHPSLENPCGDGAVPVAELFSAMKERKSQGKVGDRLAMRFESGRKRAQEDCGDKKFYVHLSDYVDCSSTRLSHLHRAKSVSRFFPELTDITNGGEFSHFVTLLATAYGERERRRRDKVLEFSKSIDFASLEGDESDENASVEQLCMFLDGVAPQDTQSVLGQWERDDSFYLFPYTKNDSAGNSVPATADVRDYLPANGLPSWAFVMPLEDKVNAVACIVDELHGDFAVEGNSVYLRLLLTYDGCAEDVTRLMSAAGSRKVTTTAGLNFRNEEREKSELPLCAHASVEEAVFSLSHDIFDLSFYAITRSGSSGRAEQMEFTEVVEVEKVSLDSLIDFDDFYEVRVSGKSDVILIGDTGVPARVMM